MWNLGETAIKALTDLPETGMGFQLVEAMIWGNATPLLVFNSERAVDLSQIDLVPGDDPSVILRNGLRVIEVLRSDVVLTLFAAPQPHSFRLLSVRIGTLPAAAGPAVGRGFRAALPSSLVKHDKLTAKRVFHRFSAFKPDRRVDPVSGSFIEIGRAHV